MIQGYKSSIARLANLFKQGRERWKQRALQLQKKLRAQEIRIRDLEKSRELWKRRAQTAEQIVREYRTTEKVEAIQPSEEPHRVPLEVDRDVGSGDNGPNQCSAARDHHYSVFIIQLAVAFVVYCLNSFRGAARNFTLLNQYFPLASPSYSSIRQWVLRVGLYELQRPRENRNDWLFIVDMTLELGTRKCLVVLGISQERWQQLVRQGLLKLSHQEMDVLAMEVMNHTKGEIIYQVLEEVTSRVGVPLQIVSDHGSDLKKGIRLYKEAHAEVLVTYDITHQSARLLKEELEKDESYQTFAHRCARTRQQLQQSPLSLRKPPTQRAKARYFNVDSLLEWARNVLAYQQRQDFSMINPCFCLDQRALNALAPDLPAASLAKLQSLKNHIYPDKEAFTCALRKILRTKDFSVKGAKVLIEADLGRRYFFEKLGWLQDYRTTLEPYTQMIALVRTLQQDIKQQGLTKKSGSSQSSMLN